MANQDVFRISDQDDETYGSVGDHLRLVAAQGAVPEDIMKIRRNRDEKLAQVCEDPVYTMQEAIDHTGFKWFQIKLSIVIGLAWMTEAMEIMLLSILGPVLNCEWGISPWKQALLSTLVMIGMTIGSVLWGVIGDKYGRKSVIIMCHALIGYFGILTAFSPNYNWVAVNRFLVGVAVGGLAQVLTLYSEFLPNISRASALVLIEIFFSVGSALEIVMAKYVVPTMGWRCLLLFTAFPIFILPAFAWWLPESARFMLTTGRYQDAVATVDRIARDNGKELPPGKLKQLGKEDQNPGRIGDLISKSRLPTFVYLNLTWFIIGFGYYGMALLAPTLFANPDGCHGIETDMRKLENHQCGITCKAFTESDYDTLIVTGLADTPGIIFIAILMLFVGRKTCLVVCLCFFSVFLFIANLCLSKAWLTLVLFISRAMIAAASQTGYTYTSEVYPTNIRAIGIGIGSGTSRIGSFVTPYIAQVVTSYNAFISISMYAATGVFGIVTTLLLPVETKGKPMKESDDDRDKGDHKEAYQTRDH